MLTSRYLEEPSYSSQPECGCGTPLHKDRPTSVADGGVFSETVLFATFLPRWSGRVGPLSPRERSLNSHVRFAIQLRNHSSGFRSKRLVSITVRPTTQISLKPCREAEGPCRLCKLRVDLSNFQSDRLSSAGLVLEAYFPW